MRCDATRRWASRGRGMFLEEGGDEAEAAGGQPEAALAGAGRRALCLDAGAHPRHAALRAPSTQSPHNPRAGPC